MRVRLLCVVIGSKIAGQVLSKTNRALHARFFPRVEAIVWNSDWFVATSLSGSPFFPSLGREKEGREEERPWERRCIALFAPVVIGQSNYFGVRFSTFI